MRRPIGSLVLGLVLWAGVSASIFHEVLLAVSGLHHDVRAKAPDFEAPSGYNARNRSRSGLRRELYFSFRDDQADAL